MTLSSMATTFLVLGLWAWSLHDVLRTDHRFVRHGPKICWAVFVGVLPIVGAVAWFLFGRPFVAVRRDPIERSRPVGPEDTPAWVSYTSG